MEMQWKQNGLLGGGKEGKCKVIGKLHGKRICVCVCVGGGYFCRRSSRYCNVKVNWRWLYMQQVNNTLRLVLLAGSNFSIFEDSCIERVLILANRMQLPPFRKC